ncbi:MAG: hypothetical protein A4E27_00427 [Methanobacterium sp. PtaU1.Bin242]|nr:MAG: hypothetical protein A4E27_00427 [Methanobacterium sp. PtaU1.Bin242]
MLKTAPNITTRCIPVVKSSAAWLNKCPCCRISGEIAVLRIIPAKDTANTIPRFLVVTRMPDATPLSLAGAAAISALLVGDWKNAVPTPRSASLQNTSSGVEDEPNWVRERNAAVQISDPINAGSLDPNLSEIIPLTGAMNIMIRGDAVKTRPVTLDPR